MKIINNKLIEVLQSDIPENGVFVNNEITEIGDSCFNDLEISKIVCKNVKIVGNYSLSYNGALVTLELNNIALTHKCIDGYPFIVENVKSSKGFKVYSGFNLDGMKVLNEGTGNEETKELKAISVKDLLPKLEKSNAYGVEKFKSLINI